MFVVSFNIMYKDINKKIILTETPYLFVNENLRNIILEIRNIIKEDMISIADEINIPVSKIALGMTIINTTIENTHFAEVNLINTRELKIAILQR
jgi:hypothetical protein